MSLRARQCRCDGNSGDFVDAEGMGDRVEAAGGDPVDALLVFVRLLIGHTDQLGHLLLRQTEHDPPLAHARADVPVDVLGAGSSRPGLAPLGGRLRHHRRHHQVSEPGTTFPAATPLRRTALLGKTGRRKSLDAFYLYPRLGHEH